MSFFAQAKQFGSSVAAGTKKAADATSRKAKRGKLQADVALLERKIKAAKQEFGVQTFDFYANEEDPGPLLNEFKTKIAKLREAIDSKKTEIASLREANVGMPETDDDGGVVI